MATYTWDHVHLKTPDPEGMAQWFEKMLGAEVIKTMQGGKPRIDVKIGGANVFIAEAEIFVQACADIIAVKQIREKPATIQHLFHFSCNGALA